MTTPVWISDHVTLITIPDSLSGSLLPKVRLSTGDLSEITDKILADSILWTSIPYGNFERACISLLLSGSFYGHLREEFSQKISSSIWHPLSISDKGDPTKFFFQTFPFTFREHLPWDGCAYILMTFLFILLRTASWDGKKILQSSTVRKEREKNDFQQG